jgi:hypothetical protein
MSVRILRSPFLRLAVALCFVCALGVAQPSGQSAARSAAQAQKIDEEYTAKIKEYTQDPRIITELVDHLPASATVPTPLKFFGRIIGTPGELNYYKDMARYAEALDKASDRALMWKIGQSEEGRDMIVLAIADEATIKQLDKYKGLLASLTDPRKTTDAQAQQILRTAKPIYWLTAGMHSGETGGPETLQELAYRLIVEETPFVQQIRNGIITFITPVIEVDGREKHVDTYYYGKKTGKQRPPLMYWGKYVAHDNNRDAMGQMLALTKNVTKTFLEWKPTVLHDLHESSTYLYASTGTGPYNEQIDPITVNEWWQLANTEVMEMTKRGVPGVWTYGFYDGWVPNYMFFIAHAHNGVGRFYEVASYGPDNRTLNAGANVTSREWYRANPPVATIKWGPRNNTNIQQSAVLIALNHVARNKDVFLENYWLKNKRSVEKGRNGPTYAWVVPASQRAKFNAADMVNALKTQGVEVHTANAAFKAGDAEIQAGDWVIRADQPYRTLVDMYTSLQNYAPANPRPYDDTGWTMQFMRNVKLLTVTDKGVLDQPMTILAADARPASGIDGTGGTLVIDHTTDNSLVTFRFKNAKVKMLAAEEDFEAGGRKFRAGAFIIPSADRAALEPSIKEAGLTALAIAAAPTVKTHELDVPRIGYVHSWSRTQDEGWVRAAFDHFGVPYTYFGDIKLREGNLRAKYDVIVFPHTGGTSQSLVNGISGAEPVPYKKSDLTPNLGVQDSADDIRGGMGVEGLVELYRFVRDGGTLIVEGSTSTLFPDFGFTSGVTVETPSQLFVRGSVMRGVFADRKSPIAYGYDAQVPVYFSQAPVLNVGGGFGGGGFGGGGFGGGGAQIPGVGQNTTPMASRLQLSPWESEAASQPRRPGGPGGAPAADDMAQMRQIAREFGITMDEGRARAILRFPQNQDDMLLSGTLVGGQLLANRAQVVDAPVGKGHVVMFAIRPFWRWQTQGTYFLGFNAILNWNDLDAGRAAPVTDGGR